MGYEILIVDKINFKKIFQMPVRGVFMKMVENPLYSKECKKFF